MSNSSQYQILEQLSKDRPGHRYAKVFKAIDRTNEQMVVLKTANKRLDSSAIISRLKHEAQFSFQTVGLPHILQVIDEDKQFTLVKKYVEGISLLKFMQPLKYNEQLKALKEICKKLVGPMAVLKEKGIAHCDIQPENILVRFDAENALQVEIIDFGLAYNANLSEKNRPLHFQLSYSAPEVILNALPLINQSVDVYSFGLCMYSLLSGERPFRHANPSIATNLALTYPLERSPKIPKDWWAVIEKATAKKSFPTPPNRMNKEDVQKHLSTAQALRYKSFQEFSTDVAMLSEQAGLFTRLGLF